MSNMLCTFSGKTGDILWSLATVQEFFKRRRVLEHPSPKVDFACMPQYRSLLPLLEVQPYIDKAFVLEDWIIQGSPFGDQPWLPPTVPGGYQEIRHLTYRWHPSGETLADHIARAQMAQLPDICAPFLYVPEDFVPRTPGGKVLYSEWPDNVRFVGYAFNWMAEAQKLEFMKRLQETPTGRNSVVWINLAEYDWLTSAWLLKQCKFFIGCRSANYVLAHGLNKKVLVYEPAGERRPATYGFRQGTEVMPDVNDMDAFVRTAEVWLNEPR